MNLLDPPQLGGDGAAGALYLACQQEPHEAVFRRARTTRLTTGITLMNLSPPELSEYQYIATSEA